MNFLNWLSEFKPKKIILLGWVSFQLGLFFLASSAFISALFLFIALILGSYQRFRLFFKDQWNYSFTLIALLMLIGSFNAYSGSLAWIGLANWIPFFFCYWAFQPYLLNPQARKRSGFLLLLGTVPVVFTWAGRRYPHPVNGKARTAKSSVSLLKTWKVRCMGSLLKSFEIK